MLPGPTRNNANPARGVGGRQPKFILSMRKCLSRTCTVRAAPGARLLVLFTGLWLLELTTVDRRSANRPRRFATV
ncbi:MAG: hypothetical protein C0629_10520 [Chromatiales bacterium]|nr:MAG: hypothetical protein C0629_10520 [Chromatiales bacterium]